MLITIPQVFDKETVKSIRQTLDHAPWEDGRKTAGAQSAQVKQNQQLPIQSQEAMQVGQHILQALGRNPLFLSAALPLKILPPMFNKYAEAETFGAHIDNAIRVIPGTNERIRTDLSCTLFFSEPDEYDGGELVIQDHYGAQSVKLNAGDMVLYPSTSLHQVTPVTKGVRVSSFFWLQSLVRDNQNRTTLFELDQNIQALAMKDGADDPICVGLTGIYHNLIRTWSDT